MPARLHKRCTQCSRGSNLIAAGRCEQCPIVTPGCCKDFSQTTCECIECDPIEGCERENTRCKLDVRRCPCLSSTQPAAGRILLPPSLNCSVTHTRDRPFAGRTTPRVATNAAAATTVRRGGAGPAQRSITARTRGSNAQAQPTCHAATASLVITGTRIWPNANSAFPCPTARYRHAATLASHSVVSANRRSMS